MNNKISAKYYQAKPTIYVVAGMVGTAVSAYLAWRAGRKSEEVIKEVKADISETRSLKYQEVVDAETGETSLVVKEGAVADKEYYKALATTYIKSGYKISKVFALPLVTEIVSLAAIGTGYGILNERHLATVAAFNAKALELTTYRKRVADRYGEKEEKELYYGYHEEEIEEPDLDENGEPKLNKRGEPKMIKTKYDVLEDALAQHSMYARIFAPEYSTQFEVESDGTNNDYYNGMFIRHMEQNLNLASSYDSYGLLYLNTVYKLFGLPEAAYGQVVGWHYHRDPATGKMIYDGDPEGVRIEAFPVYYRDENGAMQKAYILDFNVDNDILGYYPKEVKRARSKNCH